MPLSLDDAMRGESPFEHLPDRILHWVSRFLTVHERLRLRSASFALSGCLPTVRCAACVEPASSAHVCMGCAAAALCRACYALAAILGLRTWGACGECGALYCPACPALGLCTTCSMVHSGFTPICKACASQCQRGPGWGIDASGHMTR
jgi:hypothetical protein